MALDKNTLDRREFLERSVSATLGAGFISVLAAYESLFAASDPAAYDPTQHRYGMGINVKACIGCGRCVAACKKENNVPQEQFYFRTWVERYTILTDSETIVSSPNGGAEGFPPIPARARSFAVSSFPSSVTIARMPPVSKFVRWEPPSPPAMAWCSWIRTIASGVVTASKHAPTARGSLTREPRLRKNALSVITALPVDFSQPAWKSARTEPASLVTPA